MHHAVAQAATRAFVGESAEVHALMLQLDIAVEHGYAAQQLVLRCLHHQTGFHAFIATPTGLRSVMSNGLGLAERCLTLVSVDMGSAERNILVEVNEPLVFINYSLTTH